jgi:ribose transport system substrate-binding protein
MKKALVLSAAALAFALSGCKKDDGKITVAFVSNCVDPFWVIAEKGAKDAAADPKIDVNVEIRMPPNGVQDQRRMVKELLAQDVKGIAISPKDPANQGDLLDEIAAKTNLITQDSDAPNSKRLCYVGTDNYDAGRMCGKLVKKAMPNGGTVVIFVGVVDQDNAKRRRQGVIDELLERAPDPSRQDPVDVPLKGAKYTILETNTDDMDKVKAKSRVKTALTKYPQLDCMVGLFAYNPPICLDVLKDAGLVGKVKIIGFDESDDTLQGIKDGSIEGTIVQNPYKYGYESVRILAALARGDKSVLPASGNFEIPPREVTKINVDEFWAGLKKLKGE